MNIRTVTKPAKYLQLFLALILAIGLVGPASAPTMAQATNLHPLLAQMAAESPEQMVAVIVQKADASNAAQKLAVRLGGTITQDLYIINAFVAEMTAKAALKLARSSSVRWVSLDAPTVETGGGACTECIGTSNLANSYISAIGADRLWNKAPYLQGQGVTVAVVDSGINAHNDLSGRIVVANEFSGNTTNTQDGFGHGTHIAGIIGGNGKDSGGKYIGVAPKVKLVNVKVSDDRGAASMSDVIAGLQWVYQNKANYNIRVVNLSLVSSVPESYHTSPLDAAVEILWFNGIVVVVSGGNSGLENPGHLYPPANDPFVITVGAVNTWSTNDTSDDVIAVYTAYGVTESGFAKPDLVAPGTGLVSTLASSAAQLAIAHPTYRVSNTYLRMSGTSMAAPVVAGAVALLLQDEPTLTPDQVKYRLMATARPSPAGLNVVALLEGSSTSLTTPVAGYLDVYAAVRGNTQQSANLGIPASQLLWTGSEPVTWTSANWNAVNWNAVNWNAVNWNAVNWNAVNWNSDYWGQ